MWRFVLKSLGILKWHCMRAIVTVLPTADGGQRAPSLAQILKNQYLFKYTLYKECLHHFTIRQPFGTNRSTSVFLHVTRRLKLSCLDVFRWAFFMWLPLSTSVHSAASVPGSLSAFSNWVNADCRLWLVIHWLSLCTSSSQLYNALCVRIKKAIDRVTDNDNNFKEVRK